MGGAREPGAVRQYRRPGGKCLLCDDVGRACRALLRPCWRMGGSDLATRNGAGTGRQGGPRRRGGAPSVRKDGREMVFWASSRTPTLGGADIWATTRHNITDLWSTPVNLGAPINTAFADLEVAISAEGNTLVFSSGRQRAPSLGLNDIWITTRAQYFSFANTDIYLTHSQIGYSCRQSYW